MDCLAKTRVHDSVFGTLRNVGRLSDEELTRFNSKWHKEGDCHIWHAGKDPDGYGKFSLRRKTRRAHRVAWYDVHGDIPRDWDVNHICRTPACVNAQHLELVTKRDNALRDSRAITALNARKTLCSKGHPFDRAYMVKRKNGVRRMRRTCSVCEKEKWQRLGEKWRREDTTGC